MRWPSRQWAVVIGAGRLSGLELIERFPARALAVIAAVSLAYHYSLLTLARGLGLQTPFAYLAFVPPVAIALGWVAFRREPAQRPIHDRQLDFIVGLALVFAAAALAWRLPTTLAARFWLYRIDLLSLPLFAAGIVALIYGLRSLWTLRFPLGFLLLAWPVPYLPIVGGEIRAFDDVTAAALRAFARVLPLATAVPGVDTFFLIRHGQELFPLSIGSAVTEVNGLVGFILVGGALVYIMHGPWLRRVLWLTGGFALIWSLNIVRIEAIFAVGTLFGRRVAIEILHHPAASLLFFYLGVFVLLAVLRFDLRFAPLAPSQSPATADTGPRPLRGALLVSGVIAIVLSTVNAGYVRYERLATDTGQARLSPLDVRTSQVANWDSDLVATYEEGKPYFGESSTWKRIIYASTPLARLQSSVPIYLDAINTDDPNSFAAHGLEACYRFDGFTIAAQQEADVGPGVAAQIIDYHSPKENADWTGLWWEWPYRVGAKTMYERVVLFVANGPRATFAGSGDDVPSAKAARFTETNRFLVALARSVVAAHLSRAQVPGS